MDRIEETLKNIRAPSAAATALPAPPPALPPDQAEGLGELGRLAGRLRRIYGGREVGLPLRRLLFVAAADHGLSPGDAAPRSQESTAGLVRDLLAGRAPAGKPAAGSELRTLVADFGVKGEIEVPAGCRAELVRATVNVDEDGSGGTADLTERAAMSREVALAAVRAGMDAMKDACSGGEVDLVGAGAVGLGGEVASCTIAAVLTGKPVAELVGGATKRRKALAALVQKALERPAPDPLDAVEVLSEYGGLEIGGLAGACLAAAELALPVVLDGLTATAAAAIAADLAPAARGYLVASDCSTLPAHGALLEYLGLAPLLNLGLDAGDGTGAALAMDVVEMAWELASAAG